MPNESLSLSPPNAGATHADAGNEAPLAQHYELYQALQNLRHQYTHQIISSMPLENEENKRMAICIVNPHTDLMFGLFSIEFPLGSQTAVWSIRQCLSIIWREFLPSFQRGENRAIEIQDALQFVFGDHVLVRMNPALHERHFKHLGFNNAVLLFTLPIHIDERNDTNHGFETVMALNGNDEICIAIIREYLDDVDLIHQ